MIKYYSNIEPLSAILMKLKNPFAETTDLRLLLNSLCVMASSCLVPPAETQSKSIMLSAVCLITGIVLPGCWAVFGFHQTL